MAIFLQINNYFVIYIKIYCYFFIYYQIIFCLFFILKKRLRFVIQQKKTLRCKSLSKKSCSVLLLPAPGTPYTD